MNLTRTAETPACPPMASHLARVRRLERFANQYRDFARAAVGDADNILGKLPPR